MKFIGSIATVYAALTLLAAPAALAGDPSIESLDSAIQKLGSGAVAPSPAVESTPPLAPSLPPAAPPIASNASYSRVKAPPSSLSSKTQIASAQAGPVLWVYEFSASWCPSCRKLAPVVEEAANKYTGFIKYVPINVDKNQDLVRKMNIAQIPTVMVVDQTGRTLNRLVGLQQGAQLDEILEHYKTQTASIGTTQ